MSRFRKVDAGTWGDRRFAQLSQDAKLLWFFFLTGPYVTSLPGVLVVGHATIMEAMGWKARRLTNALTELQSTTEFSPVPMVKLDQKARVVFLPNGPRRNLPANSSVVKGWSDHWRCTPECDLKLEIEAQIRGLLASMPISEKTGENEFLKEFDILTGKRTPSAKASESPSEGTPCPPPSSTPSRTLCPPPTPPPSLARTRAATATATATALLVSEGVQGGAATTPPAAVAAPDQEPRPHEPLVDLGTARCEECCAVYLDALDGSGFRRSPLRDRRERQALCDAVNAHLDGDGTIRTALRQLRESVVEWVDAQRATPQYTAGWSPRKFGDWLATRGAVEAGRPSATVAAHRPRLPPLPPEPEPEPMTPEERAAIEAHVAKQGRSSLLLDVLQDDRDHVIPNFPQIAKVGPENVA